MLAWSGLIVAASLAQGAAIAVVLVAGHLYVRGQLERSRTIAHRAGLAAAAAALMGAAALAFSHSDAATLFERSSAIAAALFVVSGIAALLGGLSGKPRPAGEVAALLWCAALVALVRGW